MFQPISDIRYIPGGDPGQGQYLVAAFRDDSTIPARCAAAFKVPVDFESLFRDLLANPHIRAIVFVDDCGIERSRFQKAWDGDIPVKVKDAGLVRQYVDLYDGEYVVKGFLPAYCAPQRP